MQYDYLHRVEGFGYRISNGTHSSRKVSKDGELIYDVIYTIGLDGYRKPSSNHPFNAHLFGGSHAFGEGLNDNETLATYLSDDSSLNVKSFGVHGYGMHQALYNIQKGLSAENGFNILLTAPWHASRSACKPAYSVGTPSYVVEGNSAKLAGVCASNFVALKVLAHSEIYKLIQSAMYNFSETGRDKNLDLYLAIIREIALETQSHGSKLVIAYIKGMQSDFRKTSWSNETLMEELSAISDIFIDVTLSRTREELDPAYYLHKYDPHPSAKANKARAKLIVAALK